jgi:plastocyanin
VKHRAAGALLLALALSGCASAPAPEAPREVLIRLGTERLGVGFDPKEVHVPYVDKIRIIFRNDVDPSWGMHHNVAIAAPGREAALIASLRDLGVHHLQLAEKLRGSPNVLAMTGALSPGESEAIDFHPPGPGSYQYICLVPGHAERMGMVGVLVVEASTSQR